MKIFYVQTRSKQVDWKNDSQLEKHKCNMNNKNQTKNFHIQNENCIRFTLFCLCVNIMCLVVFLNNIIMLKYPTFFFLLWLLLLFATQLKVSLTMTTTMTTMYFFHSFIHPSHFYSFIQIWMENHHWKYRKIKEKLIIDSFFSGWIMGNEPNVCVQN